MDDTCAPRRPGGNEESETERSDQDQPDRRDLIRKLGKAAALPMIVGAFLASDVTDAAAN